jgi:protein gp37
MASKKKTRNPEMSDAGKNWNVVTGCDKYSDGCLNCYAEDVVDWLKGMGKKAYVQNGFNLTCHYDKLDWPLTNLAKKPKQPAKSFVTDMGDLFHEKVPDDFIAQVFEVMTKVPQHRFYILTKRADRLGQLGPQLPWRPWMWAGVTVESKKYLSRIKHLKKLPPEINKFIMMEPLLSPMPKLNLNGISWVVVGGETNKKGRFRPINKDWVTDIRDQVKSAGLPFMFKHWPGKSHNSKTALLDGKIWNEYPKSLLVNRRWS